MTAKMPDQAPVVVVALPFAYQDGMDKYNGIMRHLRETGQEWELWIVRDLMNVEQFRQHLSQSVTGVICGFVGYGDERRGTDIPAMCMNLCRLRKIPLVGLDWQLEDIRRKRFRRCSFLNIDSEKIGTLAAQTIEKSGNYASFGFVGMYRKSAWSRNRGAFFARELRKNRHYNVRIYHGDIRPGADELRAWLAALSKPAAVFAANDCVADSVLKTCLRSGLRVPVDLAVIGVDDDPVFCVHTRPTLTSIHPDFEEMGYLAAKELTRLMAADEKGVRMVVSGQPTVTSRTSTAPCSPTGKLVRRVDEIIEERACEDFDSNVVADELKISRRLLDLRDRQIKGMSVREAVIKARVGQAKHLLTYSGLSIGTICKMCGYRTDSYLGKVFQKQEGLSMSAYRQLNKDGKK